MEINYKTIWKQSYDVPRWVANLQYEVDIDFSYGRLNHRRPDETPLLGTFGIFDEPNREVRAKQV